MADTTADKAAADRATAEKEAAAAEKKAADIRAAAAKIPVESKHELALKGAIGAAIVELRKVTSAIHDLQDRHDRGTPTTRLQLDDAKGKIDAVVMALSDASGIA